MWVPHFQVGYTCHPFATQMFLLKSSIIKLLCFNEMSNLGGKYIPLVAGSCDQRRAVRAGEKGFVMSSFHGKISGSWVTLQPVSHFSQKFLYFLLMVNVYDNIITSAFTELHFSFLDM